MCNIELINKIAEGINKHHNKGSRDYSRLNELTQECLVSYGMKSKIKNAGKMIVEIYDLVGEVTPESLKNTFKDNQTSIL